MPLIYQQDINVATKVAVWKIEEEEQFFLDYIPIHRSIKHPKKRLQHLAGRYLLQHLYPDFPYNEIMIADTMKPFLADNKYHFSISHSKDYAAAIVSSNCRVGIDIEIPTGKATIISDKFIHPNERHLMNTLGDNTDLNHFNTMLWCAKEAMFKWWGIGNVDFKEMLRIDSITKEDCFKLHARFISENEHQPLTLYHKDLNNLCLIWVAS